MTISTEIKNLYPVRQLLGPEADFLTDHMGYHYKTKRKRCSAPLLTPSFARHYVASPNGADYAYACAYAYWPTPWSHLLTRMRICNIIIVATRPSACARQPSISNCVSDGRTKQSITIKYTRNITKCKGKLTMDGGSCQMQRRVRT